LHGPALETVTLNLATFAEVQQTCGNSALACYSPTQGVIVGTPDQASPEISHESIVMHEYGHHVAAHRSDAPWAAVDYGTKRWASYMEVCRRTRSGELYPGAESIPNYELNPGEAFAETYRVLNQRREGDLEKPWGIAAPKPHPA